MTPTNPLHSRRDFLDWTRCGLGGAAISSLMMGEGIATPAKKSHFAPRAKRVIHLCLCGGFSQVDTFDYKPRLAELHGKSLQANEKPDVFFGKVGLLRKNDWEFKQRGQSGLWISELFPHIATVADELTVINSMVAESSSHTPATFQESILLLRSLRRFLFASALARFSCSRCRFSWVFCLFTIGHLLGSWTNCSCELLDLRLRNQRNRHDQRVAFQERRRCSPNESKALLPGRPTNDPSGKPALTK